MWETSQHISAQMLRTLSTVAGAALPGEEAEGTVPRVLELTVRHRRSSFLPALPPTTKTIRSATTRKDETAYVK
jgi:hypothetical protein